MKHFTPTGNNYETNTVEAEDFCDAMAQHREAAERTGSLPAELVDLPCAAEIATEYAEMLASNKAPMAQNRFTANLRRALLTLAGKA